MSRHGGSQSTFFLPFLYYFPRTHSGICVKNHENLRVQNSKRSKLFETVVVQMFVRVQTLRVQGQFIFHSILEHSFQRKYESCFLIGPKFVEF